MSQRNFDPVRTHLLAQFPRLENPACSDESLNPELFFPESAEEFVATREMIRKICGGCGDREACLTFALDNRIEHGIWGGLNNVERSRITNRVPNTNQAREILYQVRALKRRGLTTKQACQDVGISKRTYERWLKWERTDWQQREQRKYYKSQLEKDSQ